METNLEALQKMDADEFATFMDDVMNYDNPDWEWKSNLLPLLPFEEWRDWLDRRAMYATDK